MRGIKVKPRKDSGSYLASVWYAGVNYRKTFATNARKRGVTQAVMRSIVGNSPKTMDVYTNISVEDQREAIRLATQKQHSTSTGFWLSQATPIIGMAPASHHTIKK